MAETPALSLDRLNSKPDDGVFQSVVALDLACHAVATLRGRAVYLASYGWRRTGNDVAAALAVLADPRIAAKADWYQTLRGWRDLAAAHAVQVAA